MAATRRSRRGQPEHSEFDEPGDQAGRTDYAINGGSVYLGTALAPPARSAAASYKWPVLATGNPQTAFNGIVSVHSQIFEANVQDAKDTTYLIGEKYMALDKNITGNDPGDLFMRDVGRRREPDSLGQRQPAAGLGSRQQQQSSRNPTQIFGSAHAPDGTRPFVMGTCS